MIARSGLLALKCRIVALGGARMLFPSAPKQPKKYFKNKPEIFTLYREYQDLVKGYGDSSKTPNSCNCSPYFLAKAYKTAPAVIWGVIKRYAHTGKTEVNGDVFGGKREEKKEKPNRYTKRQARLKEAKEVDKRRAEKQSAADKAVKLQRLDQRIMSAHRVPCETPQGMDEPLSNPSQDAHFIAYTRAASQLIKNRIDDTNHTQKELCALINHYRDEVGEDDDFPEIKFGTLSGPIKQTASRLQDMESEMYMLEALLGVCPEHQESPSREMRASLLRHAVKSHQRVLDKLIASDEPAKRSPRTTKPKPPRKIRKSLKSLSIRPNRKMEEYHLLCRLRLADTPAM